MTPTLAHPGFQSCPLNAPLATDFDGPTEPPLAAQLIYCSLTQAQQHAYFRDRQKGIHRGRKRATSCQKLPSSEGNFSRKLGGNLIWMLSSTCFLVVVPR